MKRRLLVFFTALFFNNYNLLSQDFNLSALTIPTNLKENANAVIRLDSTVVNVLGVDEMEISVYRVVTVLNKLGNRKVRAVIGYDDNSKISKLSAKIYNAFGKEIKKIKKNDFLDVSAVDDVSLYSDSRVKYLEYTPITYPYTIQLEYVVKTASTGFLPNWTPIEGYLVSLQRSSFTVNLNFGKARIKEKHFKGYTVHKEVADNKLHYSITNINAKKYEELSPSLETFSPKTLVALNDFETDNVEGKYTNWKEFGLWMNNALLKGRDLIGDATKQKILALVKDAKTPIEKAKIVYQFVQDKTRYISVQVGIGGIQPIAANEVDNLGYGDCKGLTNYTKALLDIVGVPSYYTHVEANPSVPISLEKDFASLEQGNHVILNLPNNGNDVWLECTSQTIPFGFLGDFTDDRNVLVITPEGGVIKRTPAYINSTNLQHTKAKIYLDEKGDVTASLNRKSYGIQYDRVFKIENYTQDDLKKYYKSEVWNYNNNLNVSHTHLINNKDSISFTEQLDLTLKEYATISEKEYLFRVNVFNKNSYVPKRYRKRKLPLQISRGYKDVDEYIIHIPKNYTLSYLPTNKKIETKFGTYSLTFKKLSDQKLGFTKELLIKKGQYPKEDYKAYRSFRKSIARSDNLRISITKKQL